MARVCSACSGTGKVDSLICYMCHGRGYIEDTE